LPAGEYTFSGAEAVLRKLIPIFVLFDLMLACRGSAQTPPAIAIQLVWQGLAQPTAIAHAGDARLFLTLQRGQVVIFNGAHVLPTAFLDLQSLVSCCGERGLLGVAFHPRYSENGFFFVDYTNGAGNTVIARYRVSASNPNVADPASGVTLLTIDQPFPNHNGGQLAFGPDGYLYVGMGDGGSANDPMCNGQRDETLLGKILRVDVDANVNSSPFYGIPPNNPFAAPGGARDEIWAKGLRNPWRFSFDRLTGDLYIGDVGQGAREEIDFQPAASSGGENYGWKVMEGTACGGGTSGCPAGVPACNAASLVPPIIEYPHSGGDCSVTGGYVYRGTRFPRLRGTYFYADYCSGKIWTATRNGSLWTSQLLPGRVPGITTFGEAASGEMYVATEAGALGWIQDSSPLIPGVESIDPSAGSTRGGESVVLTGMGFLADTAVSFGGVAAQTVAVLDSAGTRLRVVTPLHAAGTVDIVVTNPDGRSATLSGGYGYVTPVRVAQPPRAPRTVSPRS